MGRNFLGCPRRAHDEVNVGHEFVIEHQRVPASEGRGEKPREPRAAPQRLPQPRASRRRPPPLHPGPPASPSVAGAGRGGPGAPLPPAGEGPLPLPQGGVEGLPVGALQVVVVEVLELGRRGRLGALLQLQGVLLAVGSGGGGRVTVCNIGVGAGRVKFCSHLLLQGQGYYLIASWHLAV